MLLEYIKFWNIWNISKFEFNFMQNAQKKILQYIIICTSIKRIY